MQELPVPRTTKQERRITPRFLPPEKTPQKFIIVICLLGAAIFPLRSAFGQPSPSTPPGSPIQTDAAKQSRPTTGPRLRYKTPPRRPPRGEADFLEPLRFDPEDNGLSIDNPQLKWLMSPRHEKIDLGGIVIDETQVGFSLDQIRRDKANARYDDFNGPHKNNQHMISFSFQWPDALVNSGEATFEDLEGRKLWSTVVDDVQRKKWQDEFRFATDAMKLNHSKSHWGIFDIVRENFEFLFSEMPFRACFLKEVSEVETIKICSSPLIIRKKGELVRLFKAKNKIPPAPAPIIENSSLKEEGQKNSPISPPEGASDQSAEKLAVDPSKPDGIYLAGKKINDKGLVTFPIGKPLNLKIQFQNGTSIAIATRPADPSLLDAVQSAEGNEIILTGIGAQPLGNRVRVIQSLITHFWAPTGIKQDKIWQVGIPKEMPTVRILGAFNIPFTLLFNYDQLPNDADRIFIQKTRSSGTYSSKPIVLGYVPSGGEISSNEISATKTDPYHFSWKFSAPNPDSQNRATLSVRAPNTQRQWKAHYLRYRTYPSEISARLTGILEQDFTFFLMGEVSGATWFESIGGWQNKTLSHQRWGISARYLKSLSPIQTTGSTAPAEFSVLNADLKYNFLPGIWHRDELVGLNISTQQVTIAGISVSLLGGGIYWARTMPKIFDQIFNLIPMFDFPKYVDMEFIYYPVTLTSSTTGGSTYSLNFHGRVFWTRRIYGEAGFGLRRYQYSVPRPNDPTRTSTIDLSTSYGTFGLGAVF